MGNRILKMFIPVTCIIVTLSAGFLLLNKAFNWLDLDQLKTVEETDENSASTSATETAQCIIDYGAVEM